MIDEGLGLGLNLQIALVGRAGGLSLLQQRRLRFFLLHILVTRVKNLAFDLRILVA